MNARFQRHRDCQEHGLFVMVQDQGEDSTISLSPPENPGRFTFI